MGRGAVGGDATAGAVDATAPGIFSRCPTRMNEGFVMPVHVRDGGHCAVVAARDAGQVLPGAHDVDAERGPRCCRRRGRRRRRPRPNPEPLADVDAVRIGEMVEAHEPLDGRPVLGSDLRERVTTADDDLVGGECGRAERRERDEGTEGPGRDERKGSGSHRSSDLVERVA